jgi:hypothetical protein
MRKRLREAVRKLKAVKDENHRILVAIEESEKRKREIAKLSARDKEK